MNCPLLDDPDKAAEGAARSGFILGERRTVTLPFGLCFESVYLCCRSLPVFSGREILKEFYQGDNVP
jgi:hypothetical protein